RFDLEQQVRYLQVDRWPGLGCRADTLTVAGDHRLQSGAEAGPAVAYPDQVLLGVEALIWWQRHLFSRCCSIHRLMYQAAFCASWMALSLWPRSEEHTSELQSRFDLVCRLLLE